MNRRKATIGLLVGMTACANRSAAPEHSTPAAPAIAATELTAQAIPLPGITGEVSLDYLVYEPGNDRVWVPVGNSGSVDVLEVATAQFDRVNGFKTAEREVRGRHRIMGPSAVTMSTELGTARY